MLMEMVHVMCNYLKVKTKVTANPPARLYLGSLCVCGKFLIGKKQSLNPNKHSFFGSHFVMRFCQKMPFHTPDPTVTSGRYMM